MQNVNLTYNNYMKKYIKIEKEKILLVNKKYGLSCFYNPKDILLEVKKAFEELQSAAYQDGIMLLIVSGYRSYNYQKHLYNKYKRTDPLNVDNYSAKPGHSEHQTGLALDIVNAESKNIDKFKKEFNWLNKNAYKYGFILRYPKGKENITGYKYEPWHYRYVGKVSKLLYNNGKWMTLEEHKDIKCKNK